MPAPVVDLAKYRCAGPDPRISAEWRKPLEGGKRPKAMVCPADGLNGVCDDQLRDWIDRLKESEKAKRAAGLIQEADMRKCVDPAPAPTS